MPITRLLEKPLYPIMLRLEKRLCVIVGGGPVAARKAADLLAANAQVMVISPVLHPQLEAAATTSAITVRREVYTTGLLQSLNPKPLLVFAATDDSVVNAQVASEARAIDILVDVLDNGVDSDFVSMARVQRGDITLALSTGGVSPALTAHLREKIEHLIGNEYSTLAAWMRDSRSSVRETVSTQTERRDLWRNVINSDVLDHLLTGDLDAARALYDSILSESSITDEP
jgi:siroheme synthase-like protein